MMPLLNDLKSFIRNHVTTKSNDFRSALANKNSTDVGVYFLQVLRVPLEKFKFVCPVAHNCPQNCTCTMRPHDLSFNVSCQPGTLDQLPKVLPDDPPPRQFLLHFSTSYIQELEFRQYLTKTKWIDVSKSKLHSIPDKVWRTLSKMDHVDLSENQLTVLPTFLGSENITFRWLALHDNPLRCNCEDKWIRGWLQSLGQQLVAVAQTLCGTPDWLKGRNILDVTDKDFCTNPNLDRIRLIVEVCEPALVIVVLDFLSINSCLLYTSPSPRD